MDNKNVIIKTEKVLKKINPIRIIFNAIYNIFLWSSGANLDILKKAPLDKNKYFGIGGTIVFTALMASFAGGYAFYTAFENYLLSICFGIFWGSLIYNLDRYIVSTFGVGDGKKTISKQELKEAAPRLLMAIILGFVISTPLELKLFEKEINAEIATMNAIQIKQFGVKESKILSPAIAAYTNERTSIEKRLNNHEVILKAKRNEYYEADQAQRKEWNGEGSTKKRGKGALWKELDDKAKELKLELKNTEQEYRKQDKVDRKRLNILNKKISAATDKEIIEIENTKTIQEQNNGLMARLKALDRLTSSNGFLLAAKWLITLMFIFIEIAPILFKMMTERGSYDDILDSMKHKIKVEQMLLQSNLNEEVNIEVQINSDKNKQKLDAELLSNKELLNKIALAQAEIAEIAIEEWKRKQIVEVKENPDIIVKS